MAIPGLNELPFILAGPLVRRVTSQRVAVWIALRVPATVSLKVIPQDAPGSTQTSAPTSTFKVARDPNHLEWEEITSIVADDVFGATLTATSRCLDAMIIASKPESSR